MPTDHGFPAIKVGPRSRWLPATIALGLALIAFVLIHPVSGNAARAASQPTVSTSSTGLGRILVDSRGRTLYLFQKDRNGKSACAGQCATFWPPLITAGKPHVGAGARASLIGTTKRADGRMQVTYNHHPLYTFVKDTKAGQTNGENLSAFGAEWYALSPAGVKVEKSAATPTSSGGYGS